MKKWIALAFLLGFLIGPIVVVESFGTYTRHRIALQDAENKRKRDEMNDRAKFEEEKKALESQNRMSLPNPSPSAMPEER